MERDIRMEDISDGKLYGPNDLVRADCQGCTGCSACCRGMGSSIVLDPLDVNRLLEELCMSFETLLLKHVELQVVDGIILPHLKMDRQTDACTFLNEEGRCSIHPVRPGICRLFPLGRFYENRSFQYFLQTHECARESRAKIKVKKWIGMPDLKRYEKFTADWHYFLKDLEQIVKRSTDDMLKKSVSMYVLTQFYRKPYGETETFYEVFYERLGQGRKEMSLSPIDGKKTI